MSIDLNNMSKDELSSNWSLMVESVPLAERAIKAGKGG